MKNEQIRQVQSCDSNKENDIPSSYANSSSKNDNSLKLLREKNSNLIFATNQNDSEYFDLLKKKEELAYSVMEKDSILFKDKAELEYLNDILREKLSKRNKILENIHLPNYWVEKEFISQNLFSLENSQNNLNINFKNDFVVLGSKQRDKIVFNKIILNGQNNSNINEILEKEINNETESTKYYTAYNII